MQLFVDMNIINLDVDPMECSAEALDEKFRSCINSVAEDVFPNRKVVAAHVQVCGHTLPGEVEKIAESWNAAVRAELAQAVKRMSEIIQQKEPFALDTDDTYHLACCARMADGVFATNSKFGVLVDNGMGYIKATTYLNKDELRAVHEAPERYAVCGMLFD